MPPGDHLAVLFDLDGTLVDSIALILAAARYAFDGRPITPTDEQVRCTIGRPLPELFAPYAADEADHRALIERYRTYQLAHHDRLLRAYPGVPQAIATISTTGHPMGVVTSKANALARRALEHVGLASYMRVVVGLEDTERHKPDPAPVVHALARLGATADRAVFVGDSPWDMEAGRRAGVVSVGVAWGPYARDVLIEAGAAAVMDHPGELAETVGRLAVGG